MVSQPKLYIHLFHLLLTYSPPPRALMEEKVILDILTERKTAPVPSESGGKMEERDQICWDISWLNFHIFPALALLWDEKNFRFPLLICLMAMVDYYEVHWSWWGGWWRWRWWRWWWWWWWWWWRRMELGQKSSWRLIKSIWWSAPVTDPYHLEEVHYSILCFLDICKSPLFLGTPIPASDDFMFVFLVCQDIISPFGGFAVRPFFPPLLSPRKCLIQGIVQENTYQNMLGSLGSKVWIFDMAGHGCLISWCFNVCNSIERVFQPGIMHFHFFLMRFLDIFVENGLGGGGNCDYKNSQI